MIVVTQLVYVQPGKTEILREFETAVLPLLPRYGGNLLLRLRPSAATFVAGSCELPDELHLVSFESEAGLAAFLDDSTRQSLLHLKNDSVLRVLTFKATET